MSKSEFAYEYVLESLALYVPPAAHSLPRCSRQSVDDAVLTQRSEEPVSRLTTKACAGVPMVRLAV
jgi:hypothetical protein